MYTKEYLIDNYLKLEDRVSSIRFIGPQKEKLLSKLEIYTIRDLFFYFPRNYLDLSKIRKISDIRVGEQISIRGKVWDVSEKKVRPRLNLLTVTISDGSGFLAGTWFNQSFRASSFKEGTEVIFSGKIEYKFGQLQIQNPLYDILSNKNEHKHQTIHTMGVIPLYPLTKNITSTMLRRYMAEGINKFGLIPEIFPVGLLVKKKFLSRKAALKNIHFPENLELAHEARRRFLFEELFLMQLGLAMRKKRIQQQEKGFEHQLNSPLNKALLDKLPFQLTADQQRAISDIHKDMASKHPMNRLLQGEVGSGKTIVALSSLLVSMDNGYQGAFMAPTEILARQHYKKVCQLLDGLNVKVALLTGRMKAADKNRILKEINQSKINIVIGTHALIQKEVKFKNLSLVVIDEQHRFGVRQRIIMKKKGSYPDTLIMTATPIPRTLSMTLYGDLDVSIMKELPAGRNIYEQITTQVFDENQREKAYALIKSEVDKGRQAYIVCPLIEESDKLEVKSVIHEAEYLKKDVFFNYKVEIIHGQMKPEDKEKIMEGFSQGIINILISTTVIEVGIDVPKATVMMIEDAHRFGLSQLHQLRGRIGRGADKSYCLLLADPKTEEGMMRMEAIENNVDGFNLAEIDLEIRGEGQVFGSRQSGLPDLRLAKLTKDQEIILEARREAFDLIEKDPVLDNPENAFLLSELSKMFKENIAWLFEA